MQNQVEFFFIKIFCYNNSDDYTWITEILIKKLALQAYI